MMSSFNFTWTELKWITWPRHLSAYLWALSVGLFYPSSYFIQRGEASWAHTECDGLVIWSYIWCCDQVEWPWERFCTMLTSLFCEYMLCVLPVLLIDVLSLSWGFKTWSRIAHRSFLFSSEFRIWNVSKNTCISGTQLVITSSNCWPDLLK